jgi:hypothetical protein
MGKTKESIDGGKTKERREVRFSASSKFLVYRSACGQSAVFYSYPGN